MSKLYVFGIGGTGSRVLKSLTFLMASGVKVQDANGQPYEIVPIVIDPDYAAADFTRTYELMKNYDMVYESIDHDSHRCNNFFGTKINMNIIPEVRMPLDDTLDVTFMDYIGLPTMKDVDGKPDANYALTSILFSEKNMNATMEVGFKGNPNIGSVVLNQFSQSKEFEHFASTFKDNDRIFIISSIFGGTGASGFPLLLKKIRSIDQTIPGCNAVKNSVVGAITIQPYFDVKPTAKSEIDSSTFVSKTKAALSYYDRNLKEANVLYYIGDKLSKQYQNSEGGSTQHNDAHFMELAAALAIVDFAKTSNLQTSNGEPNKVEYKEFGLGKENSVLTFSELDDYTKGLIRNPLTSFVLFCKYLDEQLRESKSQSQAWLTNLKLDDPFFASDFYSHHLSELKEGFFEWLREMADNMRSFTPFVLEEKKNKLFSLVNGVDPATTFLGLGRDNYSLFDSTLNANSTNREFKGEGSQATLFMELFYKSISELISKKLKFD